MNLFTILSAGFSKKVANSLSVYIAKFCQVEKLKREKLKRGKLSVTIYSFRAAYG